ncbi:ubiquitin carboxyl-terminal hydrolase 47-like [Lampris incognitus]|uniref:ubiquitin carboxyl-terminal hydrolase 47-like n=1 Tax=Lampris incognitus TaxID=2546036 RepID=UPI0024B48D46|nr:ubiquitin carboxyl-terminal hydrolase 47-like [Lampris incognitus]XP_056156677.1 ubiquitin carboxyl-terminal hydrolase 47-like [Lampris incognitus]XP_056156678.1 ubiquitin carboxyl-terminal hydrolase 47-like [Lampris incognitus]
MGKKRLKQQRKRGTPAIKSGLVYHGLYNQGATCYLNSVLQVLFMTNEIEGRFDCNIQADLQLKKTSEDLKSGVCHTTNITSTLGIQNVYEQCDAAECLEKILHVVSPAVSEIFQGQLRYRTKCSEEHDVIEEKSSFFILPLSIHATRGQSYSVKRGFEMLFHPATFSGENNVYCNACERKTEATTECHMDKYPQILIMLLKRVDINYSRMSAVKTDCFVAVPSSLQREKVSYELYGIVDHSGSVSGGHYTATIQSSEDKMWYVFDDSHIYKAKRQPFVKEGTYMSRDAYLLMYRKVPGSQMPLSGDTSPQWPLPGAKGGEAWSATLDQVKGDEVEHGRNAERNDDGDDRQMEKYGQAREQGRRWPDGENEDEERGGTSKTRPEGQFSTRRLCCWFRIYGRRATAFALCCVVIPLLYRCKK